MPLKRNVIRSIDQPIDPYSQLQGQAHIDDKNPNLVYFDVLVSNIQQTTTAPPILQYQETKTAPFLKMQETMRCQS
jgi:hypothetical protein